MGGRTVQQSKFAAPARMLAQKKLSLGFFSGPYTTASPTVCWLLRGVSGPRHAHRQTQLQPICALAAAFASSPEKSLPDFPQISACSYKLTHLSTWPRTPAPWAAVSHFQLSYAIKELNCSFLNKACASVSFNEVWDCLQIRVLLQWVLLVLHKEERRSDSKAKITTRNKINYHMQFLLSFGKCQINCVKQRTFYRMLVPTRTTLC